MRAAIPTRPEPKAYRIACLLEATNCSAPALPRRLGESTEQFVARNGDNLKWPLCTRRLLLCVEACPLSGNSIQSLANIKNGIGGVEILVSLGKLLREGNGVFREGDFVRKPPEDGVLYRTKPTERGRPLGRVSTGQEIA